MPWWPKRDLPPDEVAALEAQLHASLVPVEVDAGFVQRFGEQLRQQRPLYVPQARTWDQAWLLFGGLSGTLLLLAGVAIALFWRRKAADS